MPNLNRMSEKLNRNLNYNSNLDDYETNYVFFSTDSLNSKFLQTEFIRKANPDFKYQLLKKYEFFSIENRTHKSKYHDKDLYTKFSLYNPNVKKTKYDGVIIFIDNNNNLKQFINKVKFIKKFKSNHHFSVTIISNNELIENDEFSAAIEVNPKYFKLDVFQKEKQISISPHVVTHKRLSREQISNVIKEITTTTLTNNSRNAGNTIRSIVSHIIPNMR